MNDTVSATYSTRLFEQRHVVAGSSQDSLKKVEAGARGQT